MWPLGGNSACEVSRPLAAMPNRLLVTEDCWIVWNVLTQVCEHVPSKRWGTKCIGIGIGIVSTLMGRCKWAKHNLGQEGIFVWEQNGSRVWGCVCMVQDVCAFLCGCVMQHLLDVFWPCAFGNLMKVHNPAVRWSSCPVPEGPRVPWRSLGVSGKGTYPNVKGIVNITDMSLSYFPFFIRFLKFLQ